MLKRSDNCFRSISILEVQECLETSLDNMFVNTNASSPSQMWPSCNMNSNFSRFQGHVIVCNDRKCVVRYNNLLAPHLSRTNANRDQVFTVMSSLVFANLVISKCWGKGKL